MEAKLQSRKNIEMKVFKIRRTDNNKRVRPNAERRHLGSLNGLGDSSQDNRLNLINMKDLEWLAWNWRLKHYEEVFTSRKQTVFENFNRSLPLLPSPEQILYGIILAQID